MDRKQWASLALVALLAITACHAASAQNCTQVASEECSNDPCASVECPAEDGQAYACVAISCDGDTDACSSDCKLADNTPVVLESAPDAEQPAANAAATEPAAEATTAEPAEDATTAPAEDATTAPAGEEAAGKTDDGSSDIEVTDDAEPDLSPPSPTALLESGPEAANPAGNETAAEPETTTETETSAEPLTKPTAQPAAEVAAEPEPNATPSGATSAPEPEPEEAEATDATEPAPESPKPAATSAPAGAVTKASPEAPEAPPAAEAPAEEEAKPVHVINTSGTHQPWTMAGGVDAPAPSAGAAGIMSDSDILFASARDTARAAADAVKDPASSNWGTDEHGLETEPVVWTVDIGADGKCPAGYYVDARVCRRCAQGHVRAAEETTCQICPPGTFADMKMQTCRPCALGNYAYWHASTRCLWCLPGTYADQLGSVKCKPCPAGTHSGYQAAKCA